MDDPARGQPLVSDHASVPAGGIHGLASGLPAPGQGTSEAVPGRVANGAIPIEAAPGELIDKITILQIKADRFRDAEKLRNVRNELAALESARDQTLAETGELGDLTAELRAVNETLWRIEDDLRDCERRGDFGPAFIELARSVYRNNDHRAAIKRRINILLGSEIIEEKSYDAREALPQPPTSVPIRQGHTLTLIDP